jgi:hypothetical protein
MSHVCLGFRNHSGRLFSATVGKTVSFDPKLRKQIMEQFCRERDSRPVTIAGVAVFPELNAVQSQQKRIIHVGPNLFAASRRRLVSILGTDPFSTLLRFEKRSQPGSLTRSSVHTIVGTTGAMVGAYSSTFTATTSSRQPAPVCRRPEHNLGAF